MSAANLFKELVVSDIREEIPGFKTIVFAPNDIAYKAGQYLTFVHQTERDEIRRSYSIVSSPALNGPLAIGVKRIPNGAFSRLLVDRVRIGDALVTTGAAGFFTLPDDVERYSQLFFFAAGSGITPIMSLVKTALHLHPHLSIVLVYSSHSREECIYYNATSTGLSTGLVELQRQFSDRLHIEFLFSNNPILTKAHLHPDLLIHFLKTLSVTSLHKTLHYICGPTNYMRMCWYVLQNEGVPAANLRKESFNADKVVTKALPPDIDSHQVVIHQGDFSFQLDVQYPDTVLRVAKQHNVVIPYSCEVGRCGSCAAKCVEGKVWMSNNEVLTDKELAEGLVLTCVGYPVGGDVVLKF